MEFNIEENLTLIIELGIIFAGLFAGMMFLFRRDALKKRAQEKQNRADLYGYIPKQISLLDTREIDCHLFPYTYKNWLAHELKNVSEPPKEKVEVKGSSEKSKIQKGVKKHFGNDKSD